ncbi:MAG: hypothetical protein RLO50_18285 [Azospirillaceae bacterium]
MTFLKPILVLGAAALLAGCATVEEYTSAITNQDIAVSSTPSGASCLLERNGSTLGRIDSTPGVANVSVATRPIVVTCDLAGYESASAVISPDIEVGSVGEENTDAVLGFLADGTTFLANSYPDSVLVTFAGGGQAPQAAPAGAVQSTTTPGAPAPAPASAPPAPAATSASAQEIIADYDARIAAIQSGCSQGEVCQQAINALVAERDRRLAEL